MAHHIALSPTILSNNKDSLGNYQQHRHCNEGIRQRRCDHNHLQGRRYA